MSADGSRSWSLRAAGAVLAMLTVVALGAPLLSPYDPNAQARIVGGPLPPLSRVVVVEDRFGGLTLGDATRATDEGLEVLRGTRTRLLRSDQLMPGASPTRRFHLLGTDRLGRDVLSRLLHGARISVSIGLVAMALAMTIGIAIGAVAALGGRWLDGILMRVVDGLLALPWLFVLIVLASRFRGSTMTLALVIGASAWMPVSRLARAELQRLATQDFVLAARALGNGPVRIFFRHLLPHAATPLMVRATLGMAGVIVTEATVSYLGFGISPPTASWGTMIRDGQEYMLDAWWIATFPAFGLAITVIALSLIGDGLRDRFDPRQRPA